MTHPLQAALDVHKRPADMIALRLTMGTDIHTLLLSPSNIDQTPTGLSTAESFIKARTSNYLRLLAMRDGRYILTDLNDDSLVQNRAGSIDALLDGGLRAGPGGSFEDTVPTPVSIPITAALDPAYFAAHPDLRGVFVEMLTQQRVPGSRGKQPGQDGYRPPSYREVRTAINYYPWVSPFHATHRVRAQVRSIVKALNGQLAEGSSKWFLDGPCETRHRWINGSTGDTPLAWTDRISATVMSVSQSAYTQPITIFGRDVATTTGLDPDSYMIGDVLWRANLPFVYTVGTVSTSGCFYVLDSLPVLDTGAEGLSGCANWKVNAHAATFFETKPRLINRLRALVEGMSDLEKANRLAAIATLENNEHASLKLVMSCFANDIPLARDCVEQSMLHKLARDSAYKVDYLSIQVDGDDTWRMIRNRASKAVPTKGVAYLTSDIGEDLNDSFSPTLGFGVELRQGMIDKPTSYDVNLHHDRVVVVRRFQVIGRTQRDFVFSTMSTQEVAALVDDVLDAIGRGTPAPCYSMMLFAQALAPNASNVEKDVLATHAFTFHRQFLAGDRGHPLYLHDSLYSLRTSSFKPASSVGIIAEQSASLFSQFYMQHAAYIQGPKTTRTIRPVTVALLDDTTGINI